MQREVTARDLSLAISIPTCRSDFEEQLHRPNEHDYVACIGRRHPGLSREGLWNLYAPTAAVCKYAAKESAALGVSVFKNYSLRQGGDVLVEGRVVTIVAHWRSTLFTVADLLDPKQIRVAIEIGQDRVCRALHRCIAAGQTNGDDSAIPSQLTNAMNRCISQESAELVTTSHLQEIPGDYNLTRVEIEERFPEWIMPSRDIELADGLTSVGSFISSIPASFNGVLDLTICNSTSLGNAIKRARPEITVVMNRRSATARNRLLLYLAVARELQRSRQLFGDASVNVRNFIRSFPA